MSSLILLVQLSSLCGKKKPVGQQNQQEQEKQQKQEKQQSQSKETTSYSREKEQSASKVAKMSTSIQLKQEQPTQDESSGKVKSKSENPPKETQLNLKELQTTQRCDVVENEHVGGYLTAGPDDRAFTLLMPVVPVQNEESGSKSSFHVLDPLKDQSQWTQLEFVEVQPRKERDNGKELKAEAQA
ncbi:hypothetical protein RB195_004172 [Necator americanus]